MKTFFKIFGERYARARLELSEERIVGLCSPKLARAARMRSVCASLLY